MDIRRFLFLTMIGSALGFLSHQSRRRKSVHRLRNVGEADLKLVLSSGETRILKTGDAAIVTVKNGKFTKATQL